MDRPTFFKSQKEFHTWLKKNHESAKEVWIGFYKTSSKKEGITYKQALDEALAYGWIDAVRYGIDEVSYTIRFTSRKPKSIWSAVNIKRIEELIKEGIVQPAGLKVYKERDQKKANLYTYEKESQKYTIDPAYEKKLKANKKAWTFFQSQAPWYQKHSIHWIMSAKQEATQLKRLDNLIKVSEEGSKLAMYRYGDKKKDKPDKTQN